MPTDNLTPFSEELLDVSDPWRVVDIRKSDWALKITVTIEHAPSSPMNCPRCGATVESRHDTVNRKLRDLNWSMYEVLLHIKVPRIRCPKHGVVRVDVPWAARSRVGTTQRFEMLVLQLLKTTSIHETAVQLNVSEKQIARIQKDAVERGLARRTPVLPRRIGVDETSQRRGHRYVTVVNDLKGHVLYVAPGRNSAALSSYFEQFDDHAIGGLEYVVMDMSAAYIAAVNECTDAAIVFDKFHVIAAMHNGVDEVRRDESGELAALGDNTLKRTRHLLHRSHASMSPNEQKKLQQMKNHACRSARAWQRVELARKIWAQSTEDAAEKHWRAWLKNVRLSRLEPMRRIADTIERHLPGIINASVSGLTNAAAESMNAKIQKVKRMAHGYRNEDNFAAAIYFHFGGLDMSF